MVPAWEGVYDSCTADGTKIAITQLRKELLEAQAKDPQLSEVISLLAGKKLSGFLADPRRHAAKVRERAKGFRLDPSDHLLCKLEV